MEFLFLEKLSLKFEWKNKQQRNLEKKEYELSRTCPARYQNAF